MFKLNDVYSCLTIMKRFTLVLVISIGLLPGLVCKAGDGSVTGDTSYKYPHESGSMTVQRSVRQNRQPRITQARLKRAGFCHDSYCARAVTCPWFPNAPGD